ncbi:DUF748 domain-containing protein [Campylobacter suis]|uniref:DUF748 domain-containing protein n=1 Tax=Campylobacter suis TaxID=2790657 RepID=A0ABN7KCB8_9BACT|nr:DUF748 domain-containing protein [Campylobacter suis]CAD7289390.1 hypothetical protein LMG8286_01777 [Campylobacter suis]
MRNLYKKYKKSCIFFLTVVFLIAFYTIFGFFGVPWILKSVIPSFLADKNATLIVKEAKFHPYKFELNATDVSLKTYADIFSVKQLDFELNFSEIFSKNINIEVIRLFEPYTNIQREANFTFNFDSLVVSSDSKNSDENDNKESFFNLTLNKFKIINGDVRYADASLKRPFEVKLNDLNYEIKNINLKEYSIGKHILETNSNVLEEFDWRGGVSLNPLKIYGDIKLGGLKMDKIWQSYMSDLDFNVTKGTIDTTLKYSINIGDEGVGLSFDDSKIIAKNFNINEQNSTIKLDNLAFEDINFKGNFSGKNDLKLNIGQALFDGFSKDEILLKSGEVNNILFNLLRDESLSLDGEISGLKISGIEHNSSSFASINEVVLNALKYDMSDVFRLNLLDLNSSGLSFKDEQNFANIDTFLIKNVSASFGLDDKQFILSLPKIGLNNTIFKNPQISVKNDIFYLNNLNLSAKDEFGYMDISGDDFGFKGTKFQGFDFDVASQDIEFLDLNVSLKNEQNTTSIATNLSNIKTKPIQVNAKNEKFVVVDDISANGLKFDGKNAELDSLMLGKSDIFSSSKSFAGFKKLAVNGLNFELLQTALDIKDVKFDSLFYNDELSKDGSKAINELAILKSNKKNTPKIAKKDKSYETNFVANIENIEFLNASSKITQSFTDEAMKHEIGLKGAKISNFSSDLSKPFGVNLALKTSDDVTLEAKGKVAIEPLNAELQTKVVAGDLTKFNAILSKYLNASIAQGVANFQSSVKLDKSYKINGKFGLKNFILNDTNGTKVAGVNELEIKKILLNKKGVDITDVTINEPFAKVHIFKDKSINLSRLSKQNDNKSEQKNEQKPNKSSKDEFQTSIKNISLNNANIDFSDDSLVLPFVFDIRNLNAQIDKVSSGDVTNISMQGTVGSGGSASIQSRIDVFEPKKFSDIKLKFKDVELNEITPYSATFVGRKIDSGLISLSLAYLIKDGKMDGKNNVVIDTIKLGESVESADAMSLPLQLAISILQDSRNIIDLNLPVSGDLDNPEFSYGGIVWQAIVQLFNDVVTSPFRLLGNVLGIANSQELSTIDFSAGDGEFMESQAKKVEQFKTITETKKDIIFVINPSYDETIDKLAIQKRLLDRDIAMQANARNISEMQVIKELSMRKFKSVPQNAYDELIKMREISESALEKLANERANSLKQMMIKTGVPSDQVKVSDKLQKVKAKMELYIPLPIGIENRQ